MEREYFIKTERLAFSHWRQNDLKLAQLLWGDPEVTKFICSNGIFSDSDILNRLNTEIQNEKQHNVQYWPVFSLQSGELVGCCGLRPHGKNEYELGFHLRPTFWGQGCALEAASAAIEYAFSVLKADSLFAGHNPNNIRSQKVLSKLGFSYIGDEFYAPTGLYHPSYVLKAAALQRKKA